MLKRLYADNFRCLENFEIRLGESQVLLGRNGTGKTSMLDVLRNLQDLIVNGLKVDGVFPARDMSLHQNRNEQRFEIETESADDRYAYRLLVEHDIERRRTRVMHEVLDHNERRLFEFANGDAQLYQDDYSAGPSVPFDWSRSGVGFLTERTDNQKVTRFKKDIANYVIASACPPIMDTESRREDRTLAPLMQNFAGWYKRAAQENMRYIPELFEALRDVIPGFEAISLAEFGETSWAPQGRHFDTLGNDHQAWIRPALGWSARPHRPLQPAPPLVGSAGLAVPRRTGQLRCLVGDPAVADRRDRTLRRLDRAVGRRLAPSRDDRLHGRCERAVVLPRRERASARQRRASQCGRRHFDLGDGCTGLGMRTRIVLLVEDQAMDIFARRFLERCEATPLRSRSRFEPVALRRQLPARSLLRTTRVNSRSGSPLVMP